MNFAIQDHGTIILIQPLNAEAREWLRENVATEPWQWLGSMLAVDRNYAGDLLAAITDLS